MKAAKRKSGPGCEGRVVVDAEVRITSQRFGRRPMRCLPGTFEWRYGRKSSDGTLYEAGVKFSVLWEKAGTAAAATADMDSRSGGRWKGIPDARVMAMDEIKRARLDMGKWSTARLVDYCVMGTPSSKMAEKYGTNERAMSTVLHEDLRACAMHFRLL